MDLIINKKNKKWFIADVYGINEDSKVLKDFVVGSDLKEKLHLCKVNESLDGLIIDKDKLNLEYIRLREIEYNKLNQNEMIFDDLVNNTTTWKDSILAIKAKYPKVIYD